MQGGVATWHMMAHSIEPLQSGTAMHSNWLYSVVHWEYEVSFHVACIMARIPRRRNCHNVKHMAEGPVTRYQQEFQSFP